MILSPIPRCPAPYGLMAFSALLVFRSSRNFIRALCNCDLLLPIEQPTIPAISLCSYPSTSCSTKTIRYPGGRFSIARSEEHTSELQSPVHLVCRLLLEKKKPRGE